METQYRDVPGETAHAMGFDDGLKFALDLVRQSGSHAAAMRALQTAEASAFGEMSNGRYTREESLRRLEKRALGRG